MTTERKTHNAIIRQARFSVEIIGELLEDMHDTLRTIPDDMNFYREAYMLMMKQLWVIMKQHQYVAEGRFERSHVPMRFEQAFLTQLISDTVRPIPSIIDTNKVDELLERGKTDPRVLSEVEMAGGYLIYIWSRLFADKVSVRGTTEEYNDDAYDDLTEKWLNWL